MNAWGKNQGIEGSNVTFMGDPSAVLTDALKLRMQHPGPVGVLGPIRCQRFAMFVDNGIVKEVEVAANENDPAGDDVPDVTLVENMLSLIPGGSPVVESEPKPSAEEISKRVSKEIEANPVVVFSKSTCPFCKKTKAAFADIGVEPTVFELDKGEMGPTGVVQDVLNDLTGARSVPRVFIGGKFIGGGDDTVALATEGKLKGLVDAAKA
jgi:glutaredoxin 3